MIFRTSMIFAAACSISQGFVRSGQTTADWWTGSLHYKPGVAVETAIRLEMDEGWHTYWVNPGEGGMKLSVEWKLPEGWTVSEPGHPVPVRFKTGELAGFGYEGVVLFPVTVTPPADASGPVTMVGKVSWLTCDDSACVPGDAELSLTLNPGRPVETAHLREIVAVKENLPKPLEGAELVVEETGEALELTLKMPEGGPDVGESEVFPETLRAVDPAAEFDFQKDGELWKCRVAKNEYASEALKELALVVAPKEGAPVRVLWKKADE